MEPRRALVVAALLLLGIPACNLPAGQVGDEALASTITAQALTIEARSNTAGDPATPEPPNVNSGVDVNITADTNCRTGPSSDYDLVLTMPAGSKSTAVGKYTPANYWIVNNPAGGTCWLWGNNVQVTGDTNALPEFPVPAAPTAKPTKIKKPTATPAPLLLNGQILVVTANVPKITPVQIAVAPNAPGNLKWVDRSCEGELANDGVTPRWKETVTLTWQDSLTETGYHVSKNNQQLPDVAAGTTSYHITMHYDQGTGGPLWTTWTVQAFNDAGTSPKSAIDVPNCP
jgi:uncharacterized protein YgiM (DUF1202 family)